MHLKKLLSVLTLYQSNIHVLHWKLTGTDFDTIHALMDKYFDQFGEFIDEVAEIGMQVGVNPVNIVEAIALLDRDSGDFMQVSGEEDFTSTTCFQRIQFMFNSLLELYELAYSDQQLPEDIRNVLQEHAFWIRKELRYKNNRRLQ